MSSTVATDPSAFPADIVEEALAEQRFEEALHHVLEDLKAAEERHDALRQSRAHANHSRVLSRLTLFAEAVTAAHLALRFAGEDPASAARALAALGSASQTLTPPEAQLKVYVDMRSKAQQAGDAELEAAAVRGLCIANLIKYELSLRQDGMSPDAGDMQGYASEALRLALEARALSEAADDVAGVFLATHLQIGALMWAGDFVSARRESSELLRLASASNLRGKLGFEAIALKHLGQLDLREGHLSEAEARVREALALHEKRRDLRQSADCFKTLSSISERKGDYKAALHWERRSSDAFARFASASAHAHASAMEVREGAARARESAALQKERADRLELTNVELAREAHEDVLTGIANRRGLDTKLTELFADRRGGRRCSLALLDVDHFKQVNDTFLHTTGDKVLARLGAVLRECSREKDVVARFGGEEFAVALVDIDPAEAGAACERIRAAVAGAAWSELHPDLLVTVSVGFAHFSEAGEGVADLVKLTDARLFDAKRAGRNRVVGPGETG